MTHEILSVSPKPATAGGLDGYEAVCSCGYRMDSLFKAQAERDGRDHVAYMAAQAERPYPCCGALTFGGHRDNVAVGVCSAKALRQAAAAEAAEADQPQPRRLTNEAIHAALGIASRHNPEGDRY